MGSIRNRDAIGEPDNNGSGTKIRGKVCENGEIGVKAYGKFQPSGISGEPVINKPSTSTSSLQKHIKNLHLELYKKLCIEHSIQPSEAIVKKAMVNEAPVLSATQEPFNKDSLLCYIFNFVITDDQVSYKLNSISFTDWSF
jgi:hypothetical protein